MPYLVCNKCNRHYKENITTCECGNKLSHRDTSNENSNEEGIFYSIDKKNLVYLEMKMLKDHKEKEQKDRAIRDLKYRIRKAGKTIPVDEEKMLKENKQRLLKELELLKKSEK